MSMLWHSTGITQVITGNKNRRNTSFAMHQGVQRTCSACCLFLAPPSGMAPLEITQFKATADTGTSYLLATLLIASSKGSSCSIGILENRRPEGGGLAAEYFPVKRPCPRGESVDVFR